MSFISRDSGLCAGCPLSRNKWANREACKRCHRNAWEDTMYAVSRKAKRHKRLENRKKHSKYSG